VPLTTSGKVVDKLILKGDAVFGVFGLQLDGGGLNLDRLGGCADFESGIGPDVAAGIDGKAFSSVGRKPCFSMRTV